MHWCIFCFFCVHFMHQRMILFVLYRLFHKSHANVAFPAIYTHVLPSLKYRRYCGIIVLKPKILYNIVWTFNKISLTGDQDKHHQKINCTFEAQSNIFKGCQYHIWNRNTKKNERTSNIYVQFILCVNICTSSTDVQLNLVVNILYC